ncbi:ATP-binding cassette domain-containing protein [Erysipelotrichaceae bacterium OttesenSCG-928-M19]|nr:ATP-binding cassette domain-containing protein [Erysipelotrichaceae bacterium OttesenSCG-928-M19]
MLEIRNLSFSYDKQTKILDDLNVQFNSGKVIAIQGESGQGKSTLLAILAGLEKDFEGQLVLDDEIINKAQLFKYSKENISMIFQELNLIKYLNLVDNIKQGCLIKGKAFSQEKMREYLEIVNLSDLDLNKYPATISGGQQQRIAIIRALLADTKIILADEPTASIDQKNADAIINELKELAKQEDKIVIVVTHDNYIAKQCNEIYYLNDTSLVKQ